MYKVCYDTNMNWDNYIQEASNLLETKEHYYRRLGQIASEVVEEMGFKALKEFAIEIKDTTGQTVSHRSLANYMWIYRKIKDLQLPEDITFTAIQLISSTENPKEWADKMWKEGLSSQEITHQIQEALGWKKKEKFIICPVCQEKIPLAKKKSRK